MKNFSSITNFGVGGIAPLITVKNKKDLFNAYSEYKEYVVIGKGTNILVSDNLRNIRFLQISNQKIINRNGLIEVGAGVVWDDFVKYAVENQLQGIECLSGIPGTVGAAPIQNIGAYGQEVSQVIHEIDCFDVRKNQFIRLNNADCDFSYRDSIFKKQKDKYIVYKVYFKLKKKQKSPVKYQALIDKLGSKEIALSKIRKSVLEIRKDKFGDLLGKGTAGSFFKNPIITKTKLSDLLKKYPQMPYFEYERDYKISGGWLIEKAGWKGKKIENVSISDKNALVLKNFTRKASAQEIFNVSEDIINDVRDKFEIELEREVRLIGF